MQSLRHQLLPCARLPAYENRFLAERETPPQAAHVFNARGFAHNSFERIQSTIFMCFLLLWEGVGLHFQIANRIQQGQQLILVEIGRDAFDHHPPQLTLLILNRIAKGDTPYVVLSLAGTDDHLARADATHDATLASEKIIRYMLTYNTFRKVIHF